MARYLDGSDASMVRAYYIGPERDRSALETFSFRPVRIVSPLAGGGVLVAETVDELTVRVLGLPPGFWAGIIGFAVAALALYAVVRETTPLARLARSVERFGEAIEPVSLPERGAREVRALIAAFNRMQSRIAELVRGRAFMLAAMSHDLRTYLTRLRLRVEMVPDADLRERAAQGWQRVSDRDHAEPAGKRRRHPGDGGDPRHQRAQGRGKASGADGGPVSRAAGGGSGCDGGGEPGRARSSC